jgi:hypothetical protein
MKAFSDLGMRAWNQVAKPVYAAQMRMRAVSIKEKVETLESFGDERY